MGAPDDEPTPERLIEALAEAGEVDAGVEVLDALRMHTPGGSSLLRLQAKLFAAGDAAPEAKRAALASWGHGALDQLARRGSLLECAVGYRVLARVFPEEPTWHERHARVESVIAPLPNPHDDPARAAIDQLVARGATGEAWEALRALARHDTGDAELARRAELFRELLADPTDTRPYRALPPDQAVRVLAEPVDAAALAASALRSVREGDLLGALDSVTSLAQRAPGNPRWVRLRDALQRLSVWAGGPERSLDDEVTTRIGPVERVDLWLRQCALASARDEARVQLSLSPASDVAAALSIRLADLDVVLDGTLPTPIPARPSAPQNQPPPLHPVEVQIVRSEPPPPPTQGNEDTEPARPKLASELVAQAPANPAPSPPSPSQPPVAGDVKVGKRKIVRLS